MPRGLYLPGHLDRGGEVQNVSEDERELVDDEVEDSPEGSEKMGAFAVEGVARRDGDLSRKGSLAGGVLENLWARRSKRLMAGGVGWCWHSPKVRVVYSCLIELE